METREAQIELWKTTIQTQQHFNDIQLRLRSFFITLYVAILTAAAYVIKEHANGPLGNWPISLASAILVLGLIMVAAFCYTDWGYHQLLIGAVKHGHALEDALGEVVPDGGLTHAISKSSKESKFLGLISTHSHSRLYWFYGSLFVVMALVAVAVNFVSAVGDTRAERKCTVTRAHDSGAPEVHASNDDEVHAFRRSELGESAVAPKTEPAAPTLAPVSPTPVIVPGQVASPAESASPTAVGPGRQK